MRHSTQYIVQTLLLGQVALGTSAVVADPPRQGELQLTKQTIYAQRRMEPSPSGGVVVPVNPPPLLWPANRSDKARHDVRLSQDPDFPAKGTIKASDLKWAMFNPHRQLEPGTWYWQYRTRKGKEAGTWSAVAEFVVNSRSRACIMPSGQELIARCPASHPRVLMKADDWPAFRKRVKDNREAAKIVGKATKLLGKELPPEDSGISKREGKDKFQKRTLSRWASKGLGGRVLGRITDLCQAYILTGDERFGREAIRHGLHVAGFDPDGVTSSKVSDFGDGSCLRALAYVYDTCFELMTEEERATVLKALAFRGNRLFQSYRNNIETAVFNAHVWQHILHEFADAAFAAVHDLPEAEEWVQYIYELCLNRFPLMGGDDGGWANGNNYFGTNLATLLYIPTFFQDLLGSDLLEQPWYRNTIYYQIYTWPPGSKCDGFGDGAERVGNPDGSPGQRRFSFVDILARHFQDAYGAWYVAECFKHSDEIPFSESSFAWFRLRFGHGMPDVTPAARFDLPQARAFRDVGVVAMHTDLANTSDNLMVAFRSSPYGSFNHMHADQNSFNVLFGGQRIFANSGYYIAYGDPHFKGWYTHSVGHNTILIDGKGQGQNTTEAYGWVPRFLNGDTIAYCVGDASHAYPKSGLTRFRRHMVLLRPRTVVVYDELEADHPAEWTWLLHSDDELKRGADTLSVQAKNGTGTVSLQTDSRLEWKIDSAFDPPADNWHGKKRGGKTTEYPDQWHARANPGSKTAKTRFLAIIQIGAPGSPTVKEQRLSAGVVKVAGWEVRGELDADIPASLLIRRQDESAVLAYGHDTVELGGKTYRPRSRGATLLVETADGRVDVQEDIDELPVAAR